MIKIELAVCMDGDGHFHTVCIQNREEIIKLLQDIEYGDFWANEVEDALTNDNLTVESLKILSNDDWENWVKQFETRGRLEFTTIRISGYENV